VKFELKLKEKFNLQGHNLGITALAYNEIKQVIYSASLDKTIKTWKLEIDQNNIISAISLSDSVEAHKKWITDLKFVKNGQLLISSSLDTTIKIWETKSDSLRSNLFFDDHSDYVQKILYLEKNDRLVSTGFEFKTNIWDLNNFKLSSGIEKQEISIISLASSEDESILFMGSNNSEIIVWDLQHGQIIEKLAGQGPISDLKAIKGQNVLVAIDEYGGFYAWNMETFNQLFSSQLKELLYSIELVYVNRNAYIIIGGTNKMHIYSFPIKESLELKAHDDKIISLLTIQVKKNHNREKKDYLISGSLDKSVKIWEITS